MSAVVPSNPACHLALKLLDPSDVCPQCSWPAGKHRNHPSFAAAAAPVPDVLDDALALWGREARVQKGIEECGELIVELCHHLVGRPNEEKVITEIADVSILLEQLRRLFGPELVDAEIGRKRARLRASIDRRRAELDAAYPVEVSDGR